MIDRMDGNLDRYIAWNKLKKVATVVGLGTLLLSTRDADAKNAPVDIMPGKNTDPDKVLTQSIKNTPSPIEQSTGTDPVGTEIAALPPASSENAPLTFQAQELTDANTIAMLKNQLGLDASLPITFVEEKLSGYDFGANKILLVTVNGITSSYSLGGEPQVLTQLDVTSVSAIEGALGITSEVSINTTANVRLSPSRSGEFAEQGATGGPYDVIGYENADGYGWYKILFTKKDGTVVEAFIADVGNISVKTNIDQFKEKPIDFSKDVITQVRQEIPADQLEAIIATLPEYYSSTLGEAPGVRTFLDGNFFFYKISDVYAKNPDGTPNTLESRTRLDFVVTVNGVKKYFYYDARTSVVSDLNGKNELSEDNTVKFSDFNAKWPVGSLLRIEPAILTSKLSESFLNKLCSNVGIVDPADCQRFKDTLNSLKNGGRTLSNFLQNIDATNPAAPVDASDIFYLVAVGN